MIRTRSRFWVAPPQFVAPSSVTLTFGANSADDYSGQQYNEIRSSEPTIVFSNPNSFEIHQYTGANQRRGLIKFTGLTNIPNTSTILAARLFLYQTNNDGGASRDFFVYRLLRDWTSGANWNTYDGTNNWGTAGAANTSSDISSSSSGSGTFTSANGVFKQIGSASGMVADVQGWVDGGLSNYGWRISVDPAVPNLTFNSFTGSGGTNGNRYYLEVEYV